MGQGKNAPQRYTVTVTVTKKIKINIHKELFVQALEERLNGDEYDGDDDNTESHSTIRYKILTFFL